MTAETLRRAAALMRGRAEAATPGPWLDMVMGSEGSIVLNEGRTISTSRKPATCREFTDAAHIASWHPAVALAVADWLEREAESHVHVKGDEDPTYTYDLPGMDASPALAAARAYLGEQP